MNMADAGKAKPASGYPLRARALTGFPAKAEIFSQTGVAPIANAMTFHQSTVLVNPYFYI
jgi:hypothetical protein